MVRDEAGPDHGSAHSVNLGPPRNRCQDNKDFTRETSQRQMGWKWAEKAGRASDLEQRKKGREKG